MLTVHGSSFSTGLWHRFNSQRRRGLYMRPICGKKSAGGGGGGEGDLRAGGAAKSLGGGGLCGGGGVCGTLN